MMDNRKGKELKVLSYMLNHTDLIPEISNQLKVDNFYPENRELFTKICELSESTSLVNDLCKLNIKNWSDRNLQNLFGRPD